MVMAGSQKITLWGPQRTPLGILRVKEYFFMLSSKSRLSDIVTTFQVPICLAGAQCL